LLTANETGHVQAFRNLGFNIGFRIVNVYKNLSVEDLVASSIIHQSQTANESLFLCFLKDSLRCLAVQIKI